MVLFFFFFFVLSIIYGNLFEKLRGREREKKKRKSKLKSDGFNLF